MPPATTDSTRTIDVGTILADTYEVVGLLGKGGMGAVWAARHQRLKGKQVAIKVLHPEVATDTESVKRFEREAQIASSLGHPNIIQVIDIRELPDGTPYLVLEYLKGETLSDRLAQGPMPLDQAMAVVRQVGSALAAAHAENIIHRDLKPANIFLCPTETTGYATEVAKVLDFGISKIRGSNTVKTQTTSMLGTPQYMAPEQATGNHDSVDARTDVFSFGVMLYEMLSGTEPFKGNSIPEVVFKVVYEEPPSLGEVVPTLSPTIVAAVKRAMSKQQEERFPDVSSFVEALTGDPLTTLRSGSAISPVAPKPLPPSVHTGRVSVASQDAYAATVAPANAIPAMTGHPHAGASVPLPSNSDVMSTADTVMPNQVAALTGAVGPGAQVATAGPAVTPHRVTMPPAGPHSLAASQEMLAPGVTAGNRAGTGQRSKSWVVVVAIVAALGAAALAFGAVKWLSSPDDAGAGEVAGGETNGTTPDDPANPPDNPPTGDQTDPVPVATTAVDAGAPVVAAVTPDAGTSKTGTRSDKNGKTAVGSKTPITAGGKKMNAKAKELLDEAKSRLAAGDAEGAVRRATRALGVKGNKNKLPIRVFLTRVYCKKRSLRMAVSQAQHLRGATRRKVVAHCKKFGIDL